MSHNKTYETVLQIKYFLDYCKTKTYQTVSCKARWPLQHALSQVIKVFYSVHNFTFT